MYSIISPEIYLDFSDLAMNILYKKTHTEWHVIISLVVRLLVYQSK